MKRQNREAMRGSPLLPMCRKAHTTSGEYGNTDKRIYCYGCYDDCDSISKICEKCGAYVWNEEPPKGEK